MKKTYACILTAFLYITQVNAQTIAEIKANSTYIWGQGKGTSIPIADQHALSDLTSQISTTIESKFTYVVKEEGKDFNESLNGIVNTYSAATLTYATRVVEEGPDGVTVLRYMPKTEIGNIFAKRGKRIIGYVANAVSAEEEGRVGDALRYYYWAQTLLSSHPDNQDMVFNVNGVDQMLYAWIPDRIDRILTLLDVKIVNIITEGNKKEILFDVYFKGKKAYNIDYTFWNGSTWSTMIGAANGDGLIELFGPAECGMEAIRIKLEYEYLNKSRMDPELPGVIQVSNLPYYKKAVKDIKVTDFVGKTKPELGNMAANDIIPRFTIAETSVAPVTNSMAVASTVNPNTIEKSEQVTTEPIKSEPIKTEASGNILEPKPDNVPPTPQAIEAEKPKVDSIVSKVSNEYIMTTLNKIMDALENQGTVLSDTLFTPEGLQIYKKLINYGKAKRLPTTEALTIKRLEENTIVRAVPFCFNFSNNNRKFIEKLSFSFDTEGKINNLSFCLTDLALKGILKQSKWSEASKWQLIDFMENYQTAYALERLDYIDKIFDNNALIIVGKRLEKAEPINDIYAAALTNSQFEFVKVSKKEYISRIKNVFANNEFVNIQFEECTVKKRDKNSEVYGIQLAQNYYSTNYADRGYLFLMIDLNNAALPKIYVRSWQPEKNEDGSIMGLGAFFN